MYRLKRSSYQPEGAATRLRVDEDEHVEINPKYIESIEGDGPGCVITMASGKRHHVVADAQQLALDVCDDCLTNERRPELAEKYISVVFTPEELEVIWRGHVLKCREHPACESIRFKIRHVLKGHEPMPASSRAEVRAKRGQPQARRQIVPR